MIKRDMIYKAMQKLSQFINWLGLCYGGSEKDRPRPAL